MTDINDSETLATLSSSRAFGRMGSSTEEDVWLAKPSYWLAIDYWLLSIFFSLLSLIIWPVMREVGLIAGVQLPAWIPLILVGAIVLPSAWKTVDIYCTTYRLTTQRYLYSRGVLSTITDEIELHRIRDTIVKKPFYLRVLGLGNVVIFSRDLSNPQIQITAVSHPDALRDMIRHLVMRRQDQIGWSESEVT